MPKRKKNGRRKRIPILYLVEGESDKVALEEFISILYGDVDPAYKVVVIPANGDITADIGVNSHNIGKRVTEIINETSSSHCLEPEDITRVIQIVDIDGAFVDESVVCEGDTKKTIYLDDSIVVNNKQKIIERNRHKSDNLNYLAGQRTIKVGTRIVPYSIYYFSCNLDHYLHNNANLEQDEKIRAAREKWENYACFPDKYEGLFKEENVAAIDMTYKQSWQYIRNNDAEKRSLKRHTNINILVDEIKELGNNVAENDQLE